MYSRVALIEPTVAFFSICFFIFWIESNNKLVLSLISGVSLFLAVITKTHGIFLILFAIISSFFDIFVLKFNNKKIIIKFIITIGVFIILFILWYFIWIKPNQEILSQFVVYTSRVPTSLILLKTFVYEFIQEYFQFIVFASIRTPIIFAVFIISIFWLFSNLNKKNIQKLKENKLLVNSIIFVFTGFLFLLLNRYIRPRFFILFFIPMIYIVVNFLFEKKIDLKIEVIRKKIIYFCLSLIVIFSIIIKFLFSTISAPLLLIILDILLIIITFITIYFHKKKYFKWLLISIYLIFQIFSYGYWILDLHYDTYIAGKTISKYIEQYSDKNIYIFSWYGATFSLEGGFKTLSPLSRGNSIEKCIENNKPKYFLLTDNQIDYLPNYVKNNLIFIDQFEYSVRGYYEEETPNIGFYILDYNYDE